jgi:hypothetical protein
LTATAEADRRLGAQFLLVWIVPVVVTAAVSFAPPILGDADTFWHLAAGRWIIDHGQIPRADPFSFTFAGRPWVAHEWLSEVIMAGAFQVAGWSGVMLLTGLSMGATAAIMARWLTRWLAPLSALATLLIGLGCIAPSLLARPHIVCLPVLALWTVALLDARRRGRAPSLWLLALMTLWANLHSSFIVGIGLVAAFGLEATLDRNDWRWRTVLGWAAFGLGSVIAALQTPHGLEGLAFPLRVMTMRTLPTISEWRGPDFLKLEPLEVAFLAGLFALLWRGVRLGAVRAALVLLLVHMAFQHVRQEVLLGVIAPLVIAEPLGRALDPSPPAPAWRLFWPQLWPRTALALALLAAVVVTRLAAPTVRTDGPTAPVTALAHVPAALRRAPVLNDYNFGGYLIFQGLRPYIDGRADMYGDAFVADNDQLQQGNASALDHAANTYKIRWAILSPNRPLVGVLDHTDGWRRLYTDRYAVVFARAPYPGTG